MRVEEAVGHSAWCAGIEKRRIPELVSQSLGSVDLAERGRDRVNQLSGGMRQRLGIACTLATEPSFLLMDEPTVGLDPLQRRGLRDLLTSLSAVTPILLSTHHVDDVCSLADVVAILKGGRLLYEGGLDDLIFDVDGPGTVARLETAYVDKVSRE
jgi:ABC-2 type transport system ATP-binding protein